MQRLKRATVRAGQCLHVETPLGIINIRAGLRDAEGRAVDSVEILADRVAEGLPVALPDADAERKLPGGTVTCVNVRLRREVSPHGR